MGALSAKGMPCSPYACLLLLIRQSGQSVETPAVKPSSIQNPHKLTFSNSSGNPKVSKDTKHVRLNFGVKRRTQNLNIFLF